MIVQGRQPVQVSLLVNILQAVFCGNGPHCPWRVRQGGFQSGEDTPAASSDARPWAVRPPKTAGHHLARAPFRNSQRMPVDDSPDRDGRDENGDDGNGTGARGSGAPAPA